MATRTLMASVGAVLACMAGWAADPLALPAYVQEVTATFATAEAAAVATCQAARLPDNAELAFSCRWDDTTSAHLPKARMMERAGVKGTFYFVGGKGKYETFLTEGPAQLMALGHAIGNHTLNHLHMMCFAPNAAFRQIAANRMALEPIVGHTIMSYVSPYGWETDPLDREHMQIVAECLVASGHYVSEDSPMTWSRMDAGTWMPTHRYSSDDRHPNREKFIAGYRQNSALAAASPDIPRLTLGTHSWCSEAGNRLQEQWINEFCKKGNRVYLNDWEYGSYRYEAMHATIAKKGVDGTRATFAVTRFAPAGLGGSMPMSLVISGNAQSVTCAGTSLQKAPRGTWTLPHAADRREPTLFACAGANGTAAALPGLKLTVQPDEAAARLVVRFVNGGTETLRNLYLAAPLPPVWKTRRLTASCAALGPGQTFERTFELGARTRPDYAYGKAFYPVSVDFDEPSRTARLWASAETPAVPIPETAPLKAARVWGPAPIGEMANVDWAAVSRPGTPLPQAASWKAPKGGNDALWTAVTSPIRVTTPEVEKIFAGDHARFIAYDFEAPADGTAKLLCSARPKYRQPRLHLNGASRPFTGNGMSISVRKGANRLILRADAVKGGHYTDVIYLAVEF